jgi:hypothetical protein
MGGMSSQAPRTILGLREDDLIVVIRVEDGPQEPGRREPDPAPATEEIRYCNCKPKGLRIRCLCQWHKQLWHKQRSWHNLRRLPAIGHRWQTTAHPAAEDRGYSLNQLEDMARERRLSLLRQSGMYVLTGVMGTKFYSTPDQVLGALKYGRY